MPKRIKKNMEGYFEKPSQIGVEDIICTALVIALVLGAGIIFLGVIAWSINNILNLLGGV